MSAAIRSDVSNLQRRTLTVADIPALNQLFAEAFTDRYRKDGLAGVRVPPLNPAIWRYAIADASDGAMCWVDDRDRPIAFNLVHQSGVEGWMGPLAVHTSWQGTGVGKAIVRAGIAHLQHRGCRVIGLETMPRTMENIGFYSRLGFVPRHLTVTLTFAPRAAPLTLLSHIAGAHAERALAECAALVHALQPGVDFTREIELTRSLGIGDTVLLHGAHGVDGFALCHDASLGEGRPREDVRVLKLAVRDEHHVPALMASVGAYAQACGVDRAAVRLQGDYPAAYRAVMTMNARVRWTDLRMTLGEYPEQIPARGVVFSNWEI